jgi:hypothetical protein
MARWSIAIAKIDGFTFHFEICALNEVDHVHSHLITHPKMESNRWYHLLHLHYVIASRSHHCILVPQSILRLWLKGHRPNFSSYHALHHLSITPNEYLTRNALV